MVEAVVEAPIPLTAPQPQPPHSQLPDAEPTAAAPDAARVAEAAARAAPTGAVARPWSARLAELNGLAHKASEAAEASVAANAAATALSAGQHRFHLAHGGYGAAPGSASHSMCPAWRLTHRSGLPRSFSAGPQRSPHAQGLQGKGVGAPSPERPTSASPFNRNRCARTMGFAAPLPFDERANQRVDEPERSPPLAPPSSPGAGSCVVSSRSATGPNGLSNAVSEGVAAAAGPAE